MRFLSPVLWLEVHLGSTGIILLTAGRMDRAWLGLSSPIPCPVSSIPCPQPCHPHLPAAAAAAWANCLRRSGPVQQRGSLEGRETAGGVRDEGTALRAREQQGAQAQWHGCQPSGAWRSPGWAQLGVRWMTCGRRSCGGERSVTNTQQPPFSSSPCPQGHVPQHP